MPGLDKTGPEGKGQKTGKGLGNCNKNKKSADKYNGESKGKTPSSLRWERRLRMKIKSGGQQNRHRNRGGQ